MKFIDGYVRSPFAGLAPWILMAPAGVMVVALLAFNFLGDGLRDALDPKER